MQGGQRLKADPRRFPPGKTDLSAGDEAWQKLCSYDVVGNKNALAAIFCQAALNSKVIFLVVCRAVMKKQIRRRQVRRRRGRRSRSAA